MPGFDDEYTAGHPKGKSFTFVPETCEKSPLKHFLENLVLLSFVIYLQSLVQECLRKHTFISNIALREKYPNTELFLVRIFLYSDWVRRFLRIQSEYRKIWTRNNSVFGHFPNSVGSYHLNFHSLQILVFQKFHSLLKVTFRTNKLRQRPKIHIFQEVLFCVLASSITLLLNPVPIA